MSSFPALPKFLRLTPSQRAKAWEGVTLRAVPAFTSASVSRTRDEDAATLAFREQEEARRKAKSMAGIARMKTRIEAKKIDYTKMRWNPRKSRFEPDEIGARSSTVEQACVSCTDYAGSSPAASTNIDAVNKDTAERLARLNGVWDDKYAKLFGGLLVMTVKNRLKGLVKKGVEIKWP